MSHPAESLRVLPMIALLAFLSGPTFAATIVVDAILAAETDSPVGGCTAGSSVDTIELTVPVVLTEPYSAGNWPRGLPNITTGVAIEGRGYSIERQPGADSFGLILDRAAADRRLGHPPAPKGLAALFAPTWPLPTPSGAGTSR